jgi:hypothetical protein
VAGTGVRLEVEEQSATGMTVHLDQRASLVAK